MRTNVTGLLLFELNIREQNYVANFDFNYFGKKIRHLYSDGKICYRTVLYRNQNEFIIQSWRNIVTVVTYMNL